MTGHKQYSLFRQGGGQDRGPAEKHPEEDADTGIHGCEGLTVKQANREIMIRGLKTRTNCPKDRDIRTNRQRDIDTNKQADTQAFHEELTNKKK